MPELRGALLAGALLSATLCSAGLPSRPAGPVLDLTGMLNQSQQAELDGICREIEASGKGVLVVAIVPTLEGDSIEGYAVRLFKEWGIGSREANNGVLLLVSTGDRKVRIETGYGVESILPDGRCGEIIRRQIIPRFKGGDQGGGVVAGARAVADALTRGASATVNESPLGRLRGKIAAAADAGTAALMLLQLLGLLAGPIIAAFWWVGRPAWPGALRLGLGAIAFGWGAPWLRWWPLQLVATLVGAGVARAVVVAADDRPRARRRSGGWSGFDWTGSGGSSGGGFGGSDGGGGSFGGFGGGFSGGGGASGSW